MLFSHYKSPRYVKFPSTNSSLTKEEIEFAFDLGVDDDNEAFDTVTIHIFK